MKKMILLMALVGFSFIGCNGKEENVLWRTGAYQEGNKVIKEYCRFNPKKGFRYELLFLELDDKGKASYVDEDIIKNRFDKFRTNSEFSNIFESAQKSAILSHWKDDPRYCAGASLLMSFAGLKEMEGIEVGRE